MIVFDRLWETMDEKNITTYQLISKYHFSKGQIDRLKRNANVQMSTLNNLCRILECKIEDIAEYIDEEA